MFENLLSSGFVTSQLLVWAVVVILAIILIVKLLSAPIKLAFKLLLHALCGLLMLMVVNFIGIYINFIIPVSWLSCLIAGILGIPGVVLLFVFQWAGII